MIKQLFVSLLVSLVMAHSSPSQVHGFLTVKVVEGDSAFNDIKHKRAHRLVVEVLDESNTPVSGAQVIFSLPTSGPGGTFTNGKITSTVTSNETGFAQAEEFIPNTVEGRFSIQVKATYQGRQGTAIIPQTNTLAARSAHIRVASYRKSARIFEFSQAWNT